MIGLESSDYLKCEGVRRLLLLFAKREFSHYERSSGSKEAHIDTLAESIKFELDFLRVRCEECDSANVGKLIDRVIELGWVEWVERKFGWVLTLTDLGRQAWEGAPPEPTILVGQAAVPVILYILDRVKTDRGARGDPRTCGESVKGGYLPEWAGHYGVSHRALAEALTILQGEGWVIRNDLLFMDRMTGFMTSGLYEITPRGQKSRNLMSKAGEDEITLAEAAEKYDIPKSAWSKAAGLPPDQPGYLPTRKVGRNRFVAKPHAEHFAKNYDARREQAVVSVFRRFRKKVDEMIRS